MTPLPKRRNSTRRGGKRTRALRARMRATVVCPRCHANKLPHRICPSCGYYNNIPILKPKEETVDQK